MKKFSFGVIFGLLVGLLIGTASFAIANQPIKLVVNGQEIQCDVPPQNINGRVLVPARFVAEALGANVEWDVANNAVVVNSDSRNQEISSNQWLDNVSSALNECESLRSSCTNGTDSEKVKNGHKAAERIDQLVKDNTSYIPPQEFAAIHPNLINLLVIERERCEVFARGVEAVNLGNNQQATRLLGATDYLSSRSRDITNIITSQLSVIKEQNNK